jgi:hypothetical protein
MTKPSIGEETTADVIAEIEARRGLQSPVKASADEFARLEAAIEREDSAQAARMPDEKAALEQMFDAFDRLKKLGWKEAIYCPKDGSSFDMIEAGSTGIHSGHYAGDWPKGSWWCEAEGDLWPSRPILFRLRSASRLATEGEVG